ncbi:MAG: lipid-A-disaccharide synthase [Nitrospirae bacterium]|uniref:lipid-A-disaccharide synthase n=1 Tax=Candidatus Magnetobacterium casense TaxID=1455061 RepID=UPI0006987F96|nr:lipid-A-disaccharide synthase [Candidatus Magnetobacterium casensis]MBF0336435.1 lipid-A-disaccharide synthase [Nitrospirota bacterium]
MPTRIMIIAGEASGELYGALLARQLKQRWPNVNLIGVGGKGMEAAGVELVGYMTGAFGLIEAASTLVALRRMYKKITALFKTLRIDVLVLIDFPDFNLRVARSAKKHGIKVLYYVSPQVWAWRRGRIKTIGRLTDRIAVLLPFEPAVYAQHGIECEFVGHPVVEEITGHPIDRDALLAGFSLNPQAPVVALLPGSRHSEVDRHLPVMVESVRLLKARHPEFQYLMPLVSHLERGRYAGSLAELEALGVVIVADRALDVLAVSTLAVVASGTAAFQAAIIGVPMVVIYRLSAFTYYAGRMLIRVNYINLVNLIHDAEIVRELIQDEATPEMIATEVERLYRDDEARTRMLNVFGRLRAMYEHKDPTKRVVEIIAEIVRE